MSWYGAVLRFQNLCDHSVPAQMVRWLLNKNRFLGLSQIGIIVSHQTNFSAQKKEFEAEKAKKRKARAKSASPKKARK